MNSEHQQLHTSIIPLNINGASFILGCVIFYITNWYCLWSSCLKYKLHHIHVANFNAEPFIILCYYFEKFIQIWISYTFGIKVICMAGWVWKFYWRGIFKGGCFWSFRRTVECSNFSKSLAIHSLHYNTVPRHNFLLIIKMYEMYVVTESMKNCLNSVITHVWFQFCMDCDLWYSQIYSSVVHFKFACAREKESQNSISNDGKAIFSEIV